MMLKSVLFALLFWLSWASTELSAQEDAFRSNYGEFYYLESGLVISQYVIEPVYNPTSRWNGIADLNNHNSYRLRDKQTRYLDVQFLSCDIDPFNPQPSTNYARNQLKNCLRAHVWNNDDIPQWAKYMGAALALGAASETGALDSGISINIDLTSLNQLFSNEE